VITADHPERVKACARGELAARMVSVAGELACLVRDEDSRAIGRFLRRLTEPEIRALLVVQAAMISVESTPAEMLRWVDWDEYGRPLPGPVLEGPAPDRASGPAVANPCGTYPAYARHKSRGELVDDDCAEAARVYYRERYERRKKARKARTAATREGQAHAA